MKINKYDILKKKHEQEFNTFPMAFAFSDEQFKEGLVKLGLGENDKDKIIGIGHGGFIRKTDIKEYVEMLKKHSEEIKDAIREDTTGEYFIKDMFEYQLANHEYGYTKDLTDTLEAIGITIQDIEEADNLRNGLNLALKRYSEKEVEEVLE